MAQQQLLNKKTNPSYAQAVSNDHDQAAPKDNGARDNSSRTRLNGRPSPSRSSNRGYQQQVHSRGYRYRQQERSSLASRHPAPYRQNRPTPATWTHEPMLMPLPPVSATPSNLTVDELIAHAANDHRLAAVPQAAIFIAPNDQPWYFTHDPILAGDVVRSFSVQSILQTPKTTRYTGPSPLLCHVKLANIRACTVDLGGWATTFRLPNAVTSSFWSDVCRNTELKMQEAGICADVYRLAAHAISDQGLISLMTIEDANKAKALAGPEEGHITLRVIGLRQWTTTEVHAFAKLSDKKR